MHGEKVAYILTTYTIVTLVLLLSSHATVLMYEKKKPLEEANSS